MILQRRILGIGVCWAALFVAGKHVSAHEPEKNATPSRRTVTTTEWPSLKGILAIDDVRNLIKVTDDENEDVRRFVRSDRPRRGGPEDDDSVPPPPEGAPLWQFELFRQERRLKGILGAERFVRLRQLQVQAGGLAAAFTRDDPSHQLGVTTEQRNQARKEIRAAAEKMNDRFRAVPKNRFDEQARLRTELYDSLAPQLTALLTDAQKEKWAEMTGEPAEAELILKIRTLGGR